MAETLGMLCDKLTIVRLKQYHTTDENKLSSLNRQTELLQKEIDEYIQQAVNGQIPLERLTFDSNKVFKEEGIRISEVSGHFGEVFSQLADINCKLWHEQEKVYEFDKVDASQKDVVVKQLAVLNLERNKCIDRINNLFAEKISQKK